MYLTQCIRKLIQGLINQEIMRLNNVKKGYIDK